MKILNYGSLNIDKVFAVDHIVRPGETINSGMIELFAGGKGANQSVALSRAGLDVWHGGKIGEDGRWLLKILEEAGVRTEYISIYEGSTGHAYIQLSADGNNSIILEGGGNRQITREDIDRTLHFFTPGDYLVLQNEINDIPYIMKQGHSRGMKICLNPAPFEEEIENWPLDLVDTLVVNEIEAKALSREQGGYEEILNALMRKHPEIHIVMTVGADGAYYGCKHDNSFYYSPAPRTPKPVVDTTAAGDTFLGYYLASRIFGFSIEEAMERASRAAAYTISRKGAMHTIPLREELFV